MGGARIAQIINEEYLEKVNNIDPLLDLSEEQIRIILLNTAGITNISLINLKALENMIGRQLSNLIAPSLSTVDSVRVEMLKMYDSIDENLLQTLKIYPRINSDVRNVLNTMLDEKLTNLKKSIISHIETFQTCLNITNPLFLLKLVRSSIVKCNTADVNGTSDILVEVEVDDDDVVVSDDKKKNYEKSDEEEAKIQKFKQLLSGSNDSDQIVDSSKQVRIHKRLTYCYFEFIRDILADYVPKRIQHKVVNLVLDDFELDMDEKVFTPYVLYQSFDEVLVEEDGIVEHRIRVEQLLVAVNKALQNMIDIQCF